MTPLDEGTRRPLVLDGVLVIDKPAGPTSHDVVALARRSLGVSRIGHTGTLDPMATGVLPLVIGRATRLAKHLSAGRKEYEATIAFGRETDTYDRAGQMVATSERRPTREELDAALQSFRGMFSQTPPAFSAKNIDGTRAYVQARKGGATAVRPGAVTVTVSRLDVVAFDRNSARLSMDVTAGFYVRSLAHDLGAALGTGGVLEALRRTRSGAFGLEVAVPLSDLIQADQETLRTRLVPFDRLLADRPAVVLGAAAIERIRHGLDVGPFREDEADCARHGVVRLLDPEGRLVALGVAGKVPGFLHASVVFGLT